MLHQLKLKCFRKHVDKVITFANGLNVIRAPNEDGKSTLIEGFLYTMFGAKVLRNSLADTVTWGYKESELRAESTVQINGRMFNFRRSKAGAECEYDGGLITGQNEVSAFAAELLMADANTVSRLMLANQGNLRGALEEGPKAVSEQIERLADFDLFDRLLEAFSEKLMTGSTASLEDQVKLLEENGVAAPVAPNVAGFDSQVTAHQEAIAGIRRTLEEDLDPKKAEAETAWRNADERKRVRQVAEDNLKQAEADQAARVKQRDEAAEEAKVTVNDNEIKGLQTTLDEIGQRDQQRKVHGELVKLMAGYPEAFWEGTKEEFTDALDVYEKTLELSNEDVRQAESEIKDIDRDIAVLKAGLITSSTCPTCGSDVSKNPKVVEQNAATERSITALEGKKVQVQEALKNAKGAQGLAKSDVADMKAVQAGAAPFERFATQHGAFVTVDLEVYPPKLQWKGEVPNDNEIDAKAIKERLVSLQDQKDRAGRAAARSLALSEALEEDARRIEKLREQLALCPEPGNVEELLTTLQKLGNESILLKDDIAQMTREIDELKEQRQRVVLQYETDKLRYEQSQALLKKTKEDLDTLNFNNALLKKIRAARPIIADKLWNMVLTSVSTMFSQMRGEKSVVTKGKDGFMVNGTTVTSLSGSALDILGLAIRNALVKTFLPSTSMLILDEPAAACDADRTAALLGFVAASGFSQTILVSHEDASEAAADHLITLN